METSLIFTNDELKLLPGLDANAYAERRAAFLASTMTVAGAHSEAASNAGPPCLLEIAVESPDHAEAAWQVALRLANAVALILSSRASLSVGRWGNEARVAIILDKAAAADTACHEAIVALLILGYGDPSTTIVRSDPSTAAAPDLFVSTADSRALGYPGLHRLRTGLTARHQPEALSLDEAIDVAERSLGAVSSNRHVIADHRRFIGAMKALRRAQSRRGEVGHVTRLLLDRLRSLSEKLVDDDSARLTTQFMFELPSE